MEEKEETISQKAFVVSPEGEIVETSREVTPEKKKKRSPRARSFGERHVEGVFRNPPGAPTPMEKEIDRIKEEKAHKARGEFLNKAKKKGPGERVSTENSE